MESSKRKAQGSPNWGSVVKLIGGNSSAPTLGGLVSSFAEPGTVMSASNYRFPCVENAPSSCYAFLPSLVQCCSREVSQPYQSPDMSWMPRRDLSAQAHQAMRRSLRVSMHVSRRRIAQFRFGLEGRASIRWMTAAAKDKCTPAIGIWRYFKLDVLDHSLFAEMK